MYTTEENSGGYISIQLDSFLDHKSLSFTNIILHFDDYNFLFSALCCRLFLLLKGLLMSVVSLHLVHLVPWLVIKFVLIVQGVYILGLHTICQFHMYRQTGHYVIHKLQSFSFLAYIMEFSANYYLPGFFYFLIYRIKHLSS